MSAARDGARSTEAAAARAPSDARLVLYAAPVRGLRGPAARADGRRVHPVVGPDPVHPVPRPAVRSTTWIAFDRGVLDYLLNSFFVVGCGLALQVLVSVFAGYALARKRFRGCGGLLALILATMMLPEEVLAVPLSVLLADLPLLHVNLVGSLAGMIVPLAPGAFSILVMTEFMKDVPRELEEAARLDGAGEFRIFWQVILPLCRPALGVIGVFGFTMIWDQYLLPLLVATDASQYTLPLALRTLRPTTRWASACCWPARCSRCCRRCWCSWCSSGRSPGG